YSTRPATPQDQSPFPTRRSSDLSIRHRDVDVAVGIDSHGIDPQRPRCRKRADPAAADLVAGTVPGALQDSVLHLATVERQILVRDRKSTRLNSSHVKNSYAVLCL